MDWLSNFAVSAKYTCRYFVSNVLWFLYYILSGLGSNFTNIIMIIEYHDTANDMSKYLIQHTRYIYKICVQAFEYFFEALRVIRLFIYPEAWITVCDIRKKNDPGTFPISFRASFPIECLDKWGKTGRRSTNVHCKRRIRACTLFNSMINNFVTWNR